MLFWGKFCQIWPLTPTDRGQFWDFSKITSLYLFLGSNTMHISIFVKFSSSKSILWTKITFFRHEPAIIGVKYGRKFLVKKKEKKNRTMYGLMLASFFSKYKKATFDARISHLVHWFCFCLFFWRLSYFFHIFHPMMVLIQE